MELSAAGDDRAARLAAPVVIIGGGPVGLCTALMLARRGYTQIKVGAAGALKRHHFCMHDAEACLVWCYLWAGSVWPMQNVMASFSSLWLCTMAE